MTYGWTAPVAEPPNLSGQVVVVTGSVRGIGRAVVEAFAGCGATVVVNGRHGKAVRAVVQALQSRGLNAIGIAADIATQKGADRLICGALRALERIDILVNNAGVSGPSPRSAWRIPATAWEDVIACNLTGAFLCTSAFMRHAAGRSPHARIINVSSVAGTQGYEGLAPYCTSKFGVRGLTEVLAFDLKETDIVATCVELTSHRTPMTKQVMAPSVYRGLPPPETAVPLFLFAATGPPELLHGRTLSESRFRFDPHAEGMLNGPLAAVRSFIPYMPRYVTTLSRTRPLHLDFLENPLGAPPAARRVLRSANTASLGRYPDPSCRTLRHALSESLGLTEDCLTFGNGSSELVQRVLQVFTAAGDHAITTDPTWPIFERFCRARGVSVAAIPYTLSTRKDAVSLSFELLLKALTPRTRLVYLVNPNNPLGCGIEEKEFRAFLDALPRYVVVVLDEAYIEYVDRSEVVRAPDAIRWSGRSVIGIRTFSKFYGLAGLRIGYACAAPPVADLLGRAHLPFAVSQLAQEAALAALHDRAHAARTRQMVQEGRRFIESVLAKRGLSALPTDASFLMGRSPVPPQALYPRLASAGIHLPQVSWNGFVQLPIGLADQNRRYLNVFTRLARRRSVSRRRRS